MNLTRHNKIGEVPTVPSPAQTTLVFRASQTSAGNIDAATANRPEQHGINLGANHSGQVIVPINDLDKPVRFQFRLPTTATGVSKFRVCSPSQLFGKRTGEADSTGAGALQVVLYTQVAGDFIYGLKRGPGAAGEVLFADFGHRVWTDVVVRPIGGGDWVVDSFSSSYETQKLGRSATENGTSSTPDFSAVTRTSINFNAN